MKIKNLILERRISNGSFGELFQGYIVNNNIKSIVAIKIIELYSNVNINELKNEIKILKILNKSSPDKFLKLYTFFKENNKLFIVQELAGLSIDKKVFNICNLKNIIINLIKKLDILKQNCIIHRDIKPSNICYDLNNENNLFFIDYGLSVITKSLNINNLIKGAIGTLNYMSINIMLGRQHSYLDDLESLLYTILFLINGFLPWFKEKIFKNIIYLKKQYFLNTNLKETSEILVIKDFIIKNKNNNFNYSNLLKNL